LDRFEGRKYPIRHIPWKPIRSNTVPHKIAKSAELLTHKLSGYECFSVVFAAGVLADGSALLDNGCNIKEGSAIM
jgi:hypothetical protein